jgi:hypothetical protein
VPLLGDIAMQIQQSFSASDKDGAMSLLLDARIHDGRAAEPRFQRCALVAAQGSLEKLRHYVKLLEVDFRDLIVAGEYENIAGKPLRIRDLTLAFRVSV